MVRTRNIVFTAIYLLMAGASVQVLGQVPERTFGSKIRESNHLLELATQEFQKENYQQALELLNQSLQYKSDNIQAYFTRALVKQKIEDPQGALVDYQIVLLLDSTYREAAFHRAKLRYQQADYQRSIDDFKKVLSMGSSGTQQVFFKGTPINQEGEVAISGITTTYSMDADIYNYIGLCHQSMNQHHQAIDAFNLALELNPNDANYAVNRGLSYAAVSNSQKAIDDFEYALKKEPGHAVAQFNLTRELETSGNLNISAYDQIIDDNPEFASAYVNRAMAKLHANDLQGALEDYNSAISIDAHDPVLYVNRGLAREKADLLPAALSDYNHAIALNPTEVVAFRSRGRVLFKMNEYQLAIEDLNEAIKLDPGFGGAYFNRALIHQKMGHINNTCQDLQTAMGLGIENAAKAIDQYCPDAQ